MLVSAWRLWTIRSHLVASLLALCLSLLRTYLFIFLWLASRFSTHSLNCPGYRHLVGFVLDVGDVVLLVSRFELRRLRFVFIGVCIVR